VETSTAADAKQAGRPGRRAFGRDAALAWVLLGVVLVLAAIFWWMRARLADEQGGAYWIGYLPAARLAQPAELAFAGRFTFPFDIPSARVKLSADEHYEAYFDGIPIGTGGGSGRECPLEVWDLLGPIAPGPHELVVVVRHIEGVASLRLSLDAERAGRNCVVTDSAWRVDDDAKRIRERGYEGARYPATLWARPPLSSWGVSSSRRLWRGSVGVSSAGVSSRIPSRAATE
jgi:hypothetical protein